MSAYRTLANEAYKLLQQSEDYAAYAAMVVRRYTFYDISTKWLVATAACAPFINQLRTASSGSAAWYAAIIPLLALVLPLVNFSKTIQLAAELHGNHAELLPQLKKLYREVNLSDEYAPDTRTLIENWTNELGDIDRRISEFRPKKAAMPDINRLKLRASRESEHFTKPVFAQRTRSEAQLEQVSEAPSTPLPDVDTVPQNNSEPEDRISEDIEKGSVAPTYQSSGGTVVNYTTRDRD